MSKELFDDNMEWLFPEVVEGELPIWVIGS